MNGRRIYWPRGKTLGGSSAINGLIYIRGQREDYDRWRALGNIGWGYDDVLPYFIRSEGNERGAGPFHGGDGPMHVSNIAHRHVLIDAFIDGAASLGVPRNDDFNGATQEGAGYFQLTTRKGWRSSAATAYLNPARRRPNLRIETGAYATNYCSRADAPPVSATGKTVAISKHVALARFCWPRARFSRRSCCSYPGWPASAACAARHYRRARAAGVGENLQDHLQIRLIYECTRPITTNDELRSLAGRIKIGLQWLFARRGPLAVGINQGGCFMRALPSEAATPDIQFHVATLSADMAGGAVHPFSGFTLSICPLRPASRGRVAIRSRDPMQPPSMQPVI